MARMFACCSRRNMKGEKMETEENMKLVRTHQERREKLNDSHIRKLPRTGSLYSVGNSEVPGLRIYVTKAGAKNFYYTYRPNNEKNWVRIKIGSFHLLNVKVARDKAKQYGAVITKGDVPVIAKRELSNELDLVELIQKFYTNRFNMNYSFLISSSI